MHVALSVTMGRGHQYRLQLCVDHSPRPQPWFEVQITQMDLDPMAVWLSISHKALGVGPDPNICMAFDGNRSLRNQYRLWL